MWILLRAYSSPPWKTQISYSINVAEDRIQRWGSVLIFRDLISDSQLYLSYVHN
jgi:hypothetical protein